MRPGDTGSGRSGPAQHRRTQLADGLARAGVATVRFDLRGHGASGGLQEGLTLAGVGNDVRAVGEYLVAETDLPGVGVVGASFSGGVCAMLAARWPRLVERLVLFNPLLAPHPPGRGVTMPCTHRSGRP